MIQKIAFTMYPVKDMKRARQFYEDALGLKATEDFRGEWIEYDLAGGCFAITSMLGDDVIPSANAGRGIAFEVDDVDGFVSRLREKGVTVKNEPFSTSMCRLAVVLDPEGNPVVLHRANP